MPPLLFFLALTVLVVVATPVQAAKPTGLPDFTPRSDLIMTDPLVRRVQEALTKEDLYHGPADGRMDEATTRAIRAYQRRSGLKEDGEVSEELAQHIETAFQIRNLLQRLEAARSLNIEKARRSLLDNPATRHLLDEPAEDTEIADPTRDPSACFSRPTPACLLFEAAESTKQVARDELRFWALGEVLVAQTKAGLAEAATVTLRRIGDPRLVMRSLRDIAIARADAGRLSEALDAAAIIPDPVRRAEALTAIAAASRDGDSMEKAQDSVAAVPDLDNRISLMCQLAVTQSRNGARVAANDTLTRAEDMARRPENGALRESALRRIATAHAEAGQPERALALLDDLSDDSERLTVLIAAANAQAQAGQTDAALITVALIEADRYRPAVLALIALAQNQQGDGVSARNTLTRAMDDCTAIPYPYAKAFAVSRVVLAMIEMVGTSEGYAPDDVLEAAANIDEPRLRAEALWALSARLRQLGNKAAQTRVDAAAQEASKAIPSRLSQVWMLADLSRSWMLLGDVPAARQSFRQGLKVAADMGNAWGRARALAKLASTLVDLED
ncbi:hypothetical protein JCM17960_04510 [Magnetospira thiophila]